MTAAKILVGIFIVILLSNNPADALPPGFAWGNASIVGIINWLLAGRGLEQIRPGYATGILLR